MNSKIMICILIICNMLMLTKINALQSSQDKQYLCQKEQFEAVRKQATINVEGLLAIVSTLKYEKTKPMDFIKTTSGQILDLRGYTPLPGYNSTFIKYRSEIKNNVTESFQLLSDMEIIMEKLEQLEILMSNDSIRRDNPYIAWLINPIKDTFCDIFGNKKSTKLLGRWIVEKELHEDILILLSELREQIVRNMDQSDYLDQELLIKYDKILPSFNDEIYFAKYLLKSNMESELLSLKYDYFTKLTGRRVAYDEINKLPSDVFPIWISRFDKK